jgi:lipoprotein-releasing system permease protein
VPRFSPEGRRWPQVSLTGIEPGREFAILDLGGYMVEGEERLGSRVWSCWAATSRMTWPCRIGQTLRLESSKGVSAALKLSGIFKTGNGGMDSARAFVSLSTCANAVTPCRKGVTRIEIKLDDLNAADATALRIRALTGLDAVPWTDGAEQLMEALNAQAQTGISS